MCLSAGSFLDSESPLLTVAAVTALGEIGRNGMLLIPVDGNGFTKLSLVDNLLAKIPSGKETGKVKQNTQRVNKYDCIIDVCILHLSKCFCIYQFSLRFHTEIIIIFFSFFGVYGTD